MFCLSQSTTKAKMTFSNLGEQPIKQGFHVFEHFAPTGSLKLKRFPVQRLPKLTPRLKTAKNDLFPTRSTTKAKMTFTDLGAQPIRQGFYVLEPLAPTGGLELKRFPSQGLTKLTPHLKQPKMTFFHS